MGTQIRWEKLTVESEANRPLYESFAEMVRKMIISGALHPGTRIPSSRKLVSAIHLSCNTIENGFRKLVRDGYLVRHPRRGTFVAESHQAHLPRVDNLPPLVTLICGASRYSRPNGFQLVILEALHKVFDPLNWRIRLEYGTQKEPIEMLCHRVIREDHPDAVMLAGFTYKREITSLFLKAGIRLVTVGKPEDFENVSYVETDHRKGMRDAVCSLLEAGHRDILLIDNIGHQSSFFARVNGYCDAFSEYHLKPDLRLLVTLTLSSDHPEEFSEKIRELSRWKCRFTAAIACGEYFRYLHDYCRCRKIRMPEDLSFIHYGNPPIDMMLPESSTSVRWDIPKLGYEAAKMLLKKENRTEKKVFPTHFYAGSTIRRISSVLKNN